MTPRCAPHARVRHTTREKGHADCGAHRPACGTTTSRLAIAPTPSRLPSHAARGGEAHRGSAPTARHHDPHGRRVRLQPPPVSLTESETPMPATDPTTLPVLVVGATSSLGSKVVDELLKRGKKVRALVRPGGP
ncbi:hypothetical protein GCM10009664_51650 [Kitasatospora gansuensis]